MAIGFTPLVAAWALGIVNVVAMPGRIGLGVLSGRIGRESGGYRPEFVLAICCCVVSAAAIWIAAPRKVRLAPGRIPRD